MQPTPPSSDAHLSLVADFGGTSVEVGLVDRPGRVIRSLLEVDENALLADVLPLLRDRWEQMAKDCGSAPYASRTIGFGFPTLIDPGTGRITSHFGKSLS